jgi:predicted RNA-binding Zn-ribbon protein involved in translation (DUF1610 family)
MSDENKNTQEINEEQMGYVSGGLDIYGGENNPCPACSSAKFAVIVPSDKYIKTVCPDCGYVYKSDLNRSTRIITVL